MGNTLFQPLSLKLLLALKRRMAMVIHFCAELLFFMFSCLDWKGASHFSSTLYFRLLVVLTLSKLVFHGQNDLN